MDQPLTIKPLLDHGKGGGLKDMEIMFTSKVHNLSIIGGSLTTLFLNS